MKKNYQPGEIFCDGVKWYKTSFPESISNTCKKCAFSRTLTDTFLCTNDNYSCRNPNRIFKEIPDPEIVNGKKRKIAIILSITVFITYITYCIIEKIVF